MKSIQGRLILTLVAFTSVLLAAAGTALYVYVRFALIKQLDRALDAQTQVLSSLVHRQPDGRITFEFPPAETVANPRKPRDFYEVCRDNGTVLLRSPTLGDRDIGPAMASLPERFYLKLFTGHPGRGRSLRFVPAPDEDEPPANAATSAPVMSAPSERFLIVVAHDWNDISESLETLLSALAITAAILLAGVAVVVVGTVRRGLRPLREIARQADQVAGPSLSYRFPVGQMPLELQPICTRLNDLLAGLETAFQRERRFTSDVAHELRTPIAELRTMTEVALRWPPADPAENYRETLAIARQLETLVTTLLALARCEAGRQSVAMEEVDLTMLLRDAWAAQEAAATQRGLTMRWALPDTAPIQSDRTILRQILANLFSNAIAYAPTGSSISCELSTTPRGFILRLANPAAGLDAADLKDMFQPFWRKDPSRTDSSHHGLGLALVESYGRTLGVSVSASLEAGRFAMTLEFPAALEVDSAATGATSNRRAISSGQAGV